MKITLQTPLEQLTRVGKTTSNQLKKIGLKKIQDLIYHYPFRYDDYSEIISIEELKTKKSGTILAKIDFIENHRSPRKRMIITEAIVSDDTDSIKVIWFNQSYIAKNLSSGKKIYLAGKIDYDKNYGLQFLNPSYELYKGGNPIHTGRLVPIYPSTARITQKQIRFLIHQTVSVIQNIEDWLPRDIRTKHNFINLSYALEQIHFPQNNIWLEKTLRRLRFDELFLIQLKNQIIRKKIKSRNALPITFKQKQVKKFVDSLPFTLTNAQKKTSWEIIKDIEKNIPMNRLLEGDVGSGKTVVAIMGILNASLNKCQTAYMAPTEILAEQHFKTISKLLKNFNFKIALLTRENHKTNKNKTVTKQEIIKKIASGDLHLVIGTHALIQEKIKFKNLALAIIDEQHRFGIKQRAALIKHSGLKNASPHFLSMTATPIPRSVALTVYGDLDLSIIDEMPPGRKQVITKIIKPKERKDVYTFVSDEIKKGRQAFIICPLIDPSDKLGVKSVTEEYAKLKDSVFQNFKIDKLHGKLKPEIKQKVVKNFVQNKTNILISTTVVEVGIDIPNATLLIIEDADRFGLAQLYQLRGRIGRGEYQSYCFLFLETKNEQPDTETSKAKQRLTALMNAKNGFELAEIDLKMRGPGEVFGTQQSGFIKDLKIANLSDSETILYAQNAAKEIITQSPNLEKFPLLKQKIGQLTQLAHLE